MSVTFTPDCFDATAPVDPDWEEVEDPSDLTGHLDGGWEAEPAFRVVTRDVSLAADALLVVAERFMMVGESGTEHGADEEWWDEEDRGPSNARVAVDDDAAYVSANTSDWLSHEMADTMKLILVQELTRAGVEAVVSADYNPARRIAARPWPEREQ